MKDYRRLKTDFMETYSVFGKLKDGGRKADFSEVFSVLLFFGLLSTEK